MLINRDEAIAAVAGLRNDPPSMLDGIYNAGLRRATIALRALPTVSVTDEMVEAVANVIGEYIDAPTVVLKKVAGAALEAALGATVSDGWEDMPREVSNEAVRLILEWEDGADEFASNLAQRLWMLYQSALGPLPAPPSE